MNKIWKIFILTLREVILLFNFRSLDNVVDAEVRQSTMKMVKNVFKLSQRVELD